MKTSSHTHIVLVLLVALISLTAAKAMAYIVIQPDADSGQDAWVGSGTPDTNFGNDTNLFFGASVTVDEVRHLYIKFDLSEVPEGTVIANAYLQFYMHGQNGFMSYPYGVYPAMAAWDEQTITWNNVPETAASPVVTFEGDQWQGNWEQWQTIFGFGGLAQSWLYDPEANHGFMIRAIDNYYGYPYIYSSDSDQVELRPRLLLEVDPVAVESRSLGSVKALFR